MKGRVLITGGAGFIGSFLADRLIGQGYTVRILDNLDAQVHPGGRKPAYLNPACEFLNEDVRNRQAVEKALKDVDAVVHFAARVGLGQSQYEIHSYTDVNISGTANVLDHWVNRYRDRIKKLIVASSMSIYGEGRYHCAACGPQDVTLRSEAQMKKGRWEPSCPGCSKDLESIPTHEGHPLRGSSVYAITKRVQEEMVLSIGKTYGLPVAALRFFNVFGPRQSLSNPYTGVLSMFLSRIKNGHSPIIYEDGRQTRDFISVHDVAEICQRCLEKEDLTHGLLNVGSGHPRSIRDIAELLIRQTNQEGRIQADVTQRYRKGDIRHCIADTSRLKEWTGFEARTSFEERVHEIMEWARTENARDDSEKAVRELEERGLV